MTEENATILVPHQLISVGKAHDYLKLKQQLGKLEPEVLWRSKKIADLYEQIEKIMDGGEERRYQGNYGTVFYPSHASDDKKAWNKALMIQSIVNEIVEEQGTLQEILFQKAEVRDMLQTLCKVYGVKEFIR